MNDNPSVRFPIALDASATSFVIAKAAGLLVNLGCGRFKSSLEAIEAAFDAGFVDFRGENECLVRVFDRGALGYLDDSGLQQRLVAAIETLLLDEVALRRACEAFPELAPVDIHLVREFMESEPR